MEIPNIPSLARDTAETIPLGDKFSGENLTYTAASSNERVAIVSVNQAILTVRAVGPGTATITVTAAAQGSADQTQTFTVTVPQPVEAPTVRTGAQTTVTVAQGATSTITLSTVFTGTGLSFTASSSDTAVATVSESGGTLTITGVIVGSATITVTATNDAGSEEHEVTVTVTAPATTPPPTSGTLTIELGESAKRTLAAGQTLQGPPDEGVTVESSPDGEPGNVWLITAKKKGIHKVTVLSAGKAVGTITVEVPNSRPLRTDDDHPNVIEIATNKANLAVSTTPALPDLDSFFTDADDDPETTAVNEEPLSYRIEDKPSWFLIETEDGFLTDADDTDAEFDLGYEVLSSVKRSVEKEYDFTVSLYASDGEDESTRPLVLKFSVPNAGLSPRIVPYTLNQRGARFNFYNVALDNPPANRLDVGPRRGVDHTVMFTLTDPAADAATGFGFANTLHKKWVDDNQLTGSVTTTDTDAHYLGEDGNYNLPLPNEKLPIPDSGIIPEGRREGDDYFILKSTGSVVAKWADTPDIGGTPDVVFKLKETGSSGTIRIEYHVWTLSRDQKLADDGTPDTTNDPRNEIPTTKRTDSRTLTITVVSCSSPPDPIAACP